MRYTDADFRSLTWHDCHVWGLEFRVGEPDDDDWVSDFVLRIDFILDWAPRNCGRVRFCIAPAVITFGAVGFTQTLVGEPLLTDKQYLTPRERSAPL